MTQPSVILATASYDHTIKFWEAKSGRCYRTIQYPESVWSPTRTVLGVQVAIYNFIHVTYFN